MCGEPPRHAGLYLMGYTPGNRRSPVRIHRIIMAAKPGEVVDHINGNPLDNRRNNLRVTTQAKNNQNARKRRKDCTSRFKGVCALPSGKWKSQIQVGGRKMSLGTFLTELEAARAYDDAVRRMELIYPRNFEDVR